MTSQPLPGVSDPAIAARGYAHPERLVSTDWLARNLAHPSLRLLECNEDVLLYDLEHIPGAQKLDWHIDLNDQTERDYIGRDAFQCRGGLAQCLDAGLILGRKEFQRA